MVSDVFRFEEQKGDNDAKADLSLASFSLLFAKPSNDSGFAYNPYSVVNSLVCLPSGAVSICYKANSRMMRETHAGMHFRKHNGPNTPHQPKQLEIEITCTTSASTTFHEMVRGKS